MTKFKAKPKIRKSRPLLNITLSEPQRRVLEEVAGKSGNTVWGLVRQMIEHCVTDMGYKWPKE